jgi:hypothetical protein
MSETLLGVPFFIYYPLFLVAAALLFRRFKRNPKPEAIVAALLNWLPFLGYVYLGQYWRILAVILVIWVGSFVLVTLGLTHVRTSWVLFVYLGQMVDGFLAAKAIRRRIGSKAKAASAPQSPEQPSLPPRGSPDP